MSILHNNTSTSSDGVVLALPSNAESVSMELTGPFTGLLVFEAAIDTAWFKLYAGLADQGGNPFREMTAVPTTSVGVTVDVEGFSKFRLRVVEVSEGSLTAHAVVSTDGAAGLGTADLPLPIQDANRLNKRYPNEATLAGNKVPQHIVGPAPKATTFDSPVTDLLINFVEKDVFIAPSQTACGAPADGTMNGRVFLPGGTKWLQLPWSGVDVWFVNVVENELPAIHITGWAP